MKELKRKEILATSIRLFAEKGFHQTSVQDIVEACGMSKGAFYGYFSSKEALHIAIFKFYFQEMQNRVAAVKQDELPPREMLREQLAAPLDYICGQKEFFVMYLREQSFSINKELREFMEGFQKAMIDSYEESLLALYGPEMRPYFGDMMLLMEGVRNSYLSAMLFLDSRIDMERIPEFLLNRLDDLVAAFKDGERQIILGDLFEMKAVLQPTPREEALELLKEMESEFQAGDEREAGMRHVLNLLIDELGKEGYDPYFVQGMLANLKQAAVLDERRLRIAALLGVDVL